MFVARNVDVVTSCCSTKTTCDVTAIVSDDEFTEEVNVIDLDLTYI